MTALAATFGGAYGLGTGLDPLTGDPGPAAHTDRRGGSHEKSPPARGGPAGGVGEPVGGLRVSSGGYALDLRTTRIEAGRTATLRFRVLGRDGRPVTEYRREHGKELHLIVASRDLGTYGTYGTYRHVHPTRAGDGTWSTRLRLPRAGDHRVFADFTPAGAGGDGGAGEHGH